VRIALAGGKPDRVPFVPAWDYDYMAKAAGREPWEFSFASVEERARIHEAVFQHHDCDIWPCWGSTPYKSIRQRQIVREQGRVYYLDLRTGRRFQIDRRGNLLDESGQTIVLGDNGEVIDEKVAAIWVAGGPYPRPVESEGDIEELLGPVPTPEQWIEDGHLSTLEQLLPRYGGTHYLTFSVNTIFAEALDLFGGFQEGLIALYSKRALFHRALESIVAWKKARLKAGASLGAPGTWMIEYCAGADTISRAMYQEFVFPYEREVVREAHRLGLQVYIWYLGHLMPFLPDLAHVEADGLFPEQGRKDYEVDIVEMRRQVGDRMCLTGFNDETAMIEGNRAALAAEIERQIRGAGSNGAFIMGTTYIIEDTPLENVDYYIETVHRLGRYA
jgi:uroporphyrinogen-III decarboxylase